jgi:hypothetical protein
MAIFLHRSNKQASSPVSWFVVVCTSILLLILSPGAYHLLFATLSLFVCYTLLPEGIVRLPFLLF